MPLSAAAESSGPLLAGAAKIVADEQAGPANDPLYTKALALKASDASAVIAAVVVRWAAPV